MHLLHGILKKKSVVFAVLACVNMYHRLVKSDKTEVYLRNEKDYYFIGIDVL